jgi:hypothetical protein
MNGALVAAPALLTKMLIGPRESIELATVLLIASASVTSNAKVLIFVLLALEMLFLTLSSASTSRPVNETFAPIDASSSPMAAPMPLDAPVTKA